MGELNQQQKDAIKKLTAVEGQNPESNMQFHGCQRELAGESGGQSWLVFVTQKLTLSDIDYFLILLSELED